MRTFLSIALVLLSLAACSAPVRNSGSGPSSLSVRVKLPPGEAASCFARNAEEHSGALIAEVRPGRDRAEVVVR